MKKLLLTASLLLVMIGLNSCYSVKHVSHQFKLSQEGSLIVIVPWYSFEACHA